ncbi:MAG TPA: hypothetical protein VJH90_01920 [archaeon]|nr:hypothetical protein [archaeon]
MSASSKGIIGEDIFATMVMMLLIFFFVLSLTDTYSKYLNLQDQIDRERRAAGTAEWIFFSNDGILDKSRVSCNLLPSIDRIGFEVKSSAAAVSCNVLTDKDRAVGSMPLLIKDGTRYYTGRLIVYVYE